MLERELRIKERHYGKDHFEVAGTLFNLAMVYGDLGNPMMKKKALQRVYPIFESHFGDDHPHTRMV